MKPIVADIIQSTILSAMETINLARETDEQLEIRPDAPIFGPDSKLDSLGLVSLLIDIEDAFADQGLNVALSDERAMSQKQSPYRCVPSLVSFIQERLVEGSQASR